MRLKRRLPDGRKLVNDRRKELVFIHCRTDPCRDAGSGGRTSVYSTENGELYIEWLGKWERIVHLGTSEESGRELGKGDWYEVVSHAGGYP